MMLARAPTSAWLSACLQQARPIEIERPRRIDELDHVQPPLTGSIFQDELLTLAQLLRKLRPAQAGTPAPAVIARTSLH